MRSLVVTCEHGGCRVPPRYRGLFRGRGVFLASHRGWDPGALELARAFRAPLRFFATTSRLVVDLNRSLGHRRLFSEMTRRLPRGERERILARHYRPYRDAAARAIARAAPAVHLSVHTFTPVLGGERRRMDVGILYDPARRAERAFCRRWVVALRGEGFAVRCNAPYRGVSDGFTSWLRRRLPERSYLGVELEVNQKHPRAGGRAWARLRESLVRTLRATMAE